MKKKVYFIVVQTHNMNVANDELYVDWMSKWRLWKKAWCENDEPVVDFYIKFICKGGIFKPTDHADLASEVGHAIASSRIDKSGVLQVNNGAVVLPTISVIPTTNRLGIVTLRLSFLSRPEILKIAVVLEKLGHGVLHDNGRVISTSYPNDDKSPRKMPFRDDPVWAIIEDDLATRRI